MSIVETILVFVVIPLGIFGLVSLMTLRQKFAGTPRYRPGDEWNYPPVWWSANPEGAGNGHAYSDHPGDSSSDEPETVATQRGGASGSW